MAQIINQIRDNSLTNLIVNYLPQSMTDKELFSMFVTIGPVESCRVMRDNKTGYSYGFGFVNFNRTEDAEKAILQLNGLPIQNKKLKVSYARPSGEDIKDTNLYITNLPRALTEQQLDDMFCRFGKIVQKNILKDKITGLPRGVAFVRFDKRSEAMDAMEQMNGKIPDGCIEPLAIKIAEEHGKRKAAYYAGFQAGYVQSRGGGTTTSTTPQTQKRSNNVGTNNRAGLSSSLRPPPFPAVYSMMRAGLSTGYGGALRQDKSHYRYNPVGSATAPIPNLGYNFSSGGYY